MGRSSIGRAPVSKTGGYRFKSCRPSVIWLLIGVPVVIVLIFAGTCVWDRVIEPYEDERKFFDSLGR